MTRHILALLTIVWWSLKHPYAKTFEVWKGHQSTLWNVVPLWAVAEVACNIERYQECRWFLLLFFARERPRRLCLSQQPGAMCTPELLSKSCHHLRQRLARARGSLEQFSGFLLLSGMLLTLLPRLPQGPFSDICLVCPIFVPIIFGFRLKSSWILELVLSTAFNPGKAWVKTLSQLRRRFNS